MKTLGTQENSAFHTLSPLTADIVRISFLDTLFLPKVQILNIFPSSYVHRFLFALY